MSRTHPVWWQWLGQTWVESGCHLTENLRTALGTVEPSDPRSPSSQPTMAPSVQRVGLTDGVLRG